jgi:hypothetical protein
MQSGGRAARPCGHLGLSAGPGLDVVLAQNAPLEAERPWVRASMRFWSIAGNSGLQPLRNRRLKLDWLDSLEATGRKITIDRGLDGGGPLVDHQVDGWPIDTATVRGDPANGDPYAFVISANIRRRHLTAEQKRDLIAKVLKAQPRKSNRQIAKATGTSHRIKSFCGALAAAFRTAMVAYLRRSRSVQ